MKLNLYAVLLATITFLTCIVTINLLPSTGSVKAGNYSYLYRL